MKLPEIELVDGGVRVTVWRKLSGSFNTTQTLSEVQKAIVEILRENPSLNRKDLSTRVGNITEDGIKYHLKKLQKIGALRREGPDYGGRWIVLSNNGNDSSSKLRKNRK